MNTYPKIGHRFGVLRSYVWVHTFFYASWIVFFVICTDVRQSNTYINTCSCILCLSEPCQCVVAQKWSMLFPKKQSWCCSAEGSKKFNVRRVLTANTRKGFEVTTVSLIGSLRPAEWNAARLDKWMRRNTKTRHQSLCLPPEVAPRHKVRPRPKRTRRKEFRMQRRRTARRRRRRSRRELELSSRVS